MNKSTLHTPELNGLKEALFQRIDQFADKPQLVKIINGIKPEGFVGRLAGLEEYVENTLLFGQTEKSD